MPDPYSTWIFMQVILVDLNMTRTRILQTHLQKFGSGLSSVCIMIYDHPLIKAFIWAHCRISALSSKLLTLTWKTWSDLIQNNFVVGPYEICLKRSTTGWKKIQVTRITKGRQRVLAQLDGTCMCHRRSLVRFLLPM